MSSLYIHYLTTVNGERRRIPEYLHPRGGLIRWIKSRKILERRVRVESPEDFQAMLDEGRKFRLYKFNLDRHRWRSVLEMDSSTTRIEGDDLVYLDSARPFRYSGALIGATDENCLDSMIIEVEALSVDERAAKKANEAIIEVSRRPSSINPYVG